MNKLILLFVIISSAISIIQSKDIVALSPENITLVMGNYDMGFIMFYEPESPRYQSYGPVLDSTVAEVHAKKYNTTVLIAELNTDKYPQMKEKYGLSQSPSIVWFNNKRNYSIEYSGETEMTKSFIEFIELQLYFTETSVKEIVYEDLKQLLSIDPSANQLKTSNSNEINSNMIVICAKNKEQHSKDFQIIVNSAWNSGIKHIYYTKDKAFDSICSNDKYLDVVVYKLNERNAIKGLYEVMRLDANDVSQEENYPNMIHFEHFASFSSQKMERLFNMFSKDTINLFTHNNENLITQGITTMTLVHNYKLDSQDYSSLLNGLISIAKDNRKSLIFMIGAPRTRLSQQFVETYRLSEANLPILCVTTNGNPKIEKYRLVLPSSSTDMIINEIKSFIVKFNKKQLTQYISSEDLPIPVIESNGLHRLVGINYSETLNQKKDVLVVFCSEKISQCREFMPRLEKMALRLRDSKDLIIASVNPYTNEIEYGGFNYLPGIILFPDVPMNKGEQGIEYKGKALTRDIIKFLKENAKHPIEVREANEKDVKEEYTKEIKRLNLNDKGVGRKLFMQLSDPDLSQMYLMPNKEVVKTEQEYIQHIIYSHNQEIDEKEDL